LLEQGFKSDSDDYEFHLDIGMIQSKDYGVYGGAFDPVIIPV